MSKLPTTLVTRNHPYTSIDVPWQMDDDRATSPLFRYLRGGGSRAFGMTAEAVARERRQNRFLWMAGAVGALYALLWAW